MTIVFILTILLLSFSSQASVPLTSSFVSGDSVDAILSSFSPDLIRLPKSNVAPLLLLKKSKKGSIISLPVSERDGLQPNKGTTFTGYPFQLNRYGNENKEQCKTDGKSPPSQQEQQSKKQSDKGQGSSGSSGSSGTGAASASASGNDESHARHLEKLKEILKAAEKSLKTMDQKKNIDDFLAELKRLYVASPHLLEEKGSLVNREYSWKAILRLLKHHFSDKLEEGEMSHVLLEYPGFEDLPEELIRLLARNVLPESALPQGVPKETLVHFIVNSVSPITLWYMQTHLGHPQCLQQLIGLFITQLPLMATGESKKFIFQDHTSHVNVFFIRKNAKGRYRVFVVDSLRVFKRYNEGQVYSPLAHFVTLALTLALKYHGFTDSRFYFLPERQCQYCNLGSETFMLHDLKTLLEFPMLAGNGYYVDKEPLANDNMFRFFFNITYDPAEQLGRLRVNGEIKYFTDTADKPALNAHDLSTLIIMSLHTWSSMGLEPDLFKFYQLRQFPQRFAYLTQGQQRLKRLLEKFPEERQKEVDQVVDETRGLLSGNDGICNNNTNLAATLLWMKMNIELLDMNRPGQEK
ncbi:hypothetical protein [Endozoicomonas sp. 8E]|uniref:hypothetical protein n=1 Tax=Endozoicomonas sp. 8E TaxID=3035692 RepID=UPI002939169A|nr:hypothetical protein [Endozoicomonas sp. 8E]WOG26151.1 hypothetical protein P6910_16465 [Endozoicomonas sp. 8E]